VQSVSQIKAMLAERGLRPKRSLGQNFLIDQNLLRKLVDAAGVGEGDAVLEVGPGTGTLTEELLARGCRVVASELDDALADLLEERAGEMERAGGGAGRLTIVRGDCLASKRQVNPALLEALGEGPFSLVANLPYGAATPLLLTLLAEHPRCGVMAVTIQREVADRLLAPPGTKEYGLLTVLARAMAHVERLATLPPSCFWPAPEVSSAMVLLRRRGTAAMLTDDPAALRAICERLFASRRKQIGGVLGREAKLPAGVMPTMRAEELTPEQLIEMSKAGQRSE
jgi:16S rRNA (adenine1518-N6/adenine1519-N6)-dimethyltransferase